MSRSFWGQAVEYTGMVPLFYGSIAAGLWSAVQGEGFAKGLDDAEETISKAVEKAANFVDAHKDEINDVVRPIAIGVAYRFLGDKADAFARRYFY